MSRRLRVLLVEDEALVADFVADLVEEAGHEVVGITATGQRAVELLDGEGIDLAILDITLKGTMTGIEVAGVARERRVPHLFISGSGDPATRAAALATGPVSFLLKPFNQDTLLHVLAGLATDR
jgi:CheY-like chemotaxis protein